MAQSLQDEIEKLIAASGVKACGVAFQDLASGSELLLRADEPFYPASTFKLAVMMEIYHQVALGEISLDELLLVKNEFASLADGSPYSLSEAEDSESGLYARLGQVLPIRDLNQRMIAWSSNLASCLLVEKAGAARVTAFMESIGAAGLVVRRGAEDKKAYALGLNNSATARALMQALLQLEQGRVVSPAASAEMVGLLRQQHFNEGIPSPLPAGVSVAHKTGWNDRIYHDAAIVYPPGRGPYILVVMTRGLPELDAAPALVAAISKTVYQYLIPPSPPGNR